MTCWSSFLKYNLSQIQNYLPNSWKQPLTQHKFALLKQKFQLESLSFSLKTFAHQGDLFKAFKTYSSLQNHISSSIHSYSLIVLHSISSLFSCCNTIRTFSQGTQLHAHVIRLGFVHDPILVSKIVTLYTGFGFVSDAHVFVLDSKYGGSVGWNLLISSYVKNGFCKKALVAYKQMVDLGVKADKFTYPSVLKACSNEFNLGFGREVHLAIHCSDAEEDLFVINALVTMYVKCGELNVARSMFDKMPVRDVVSWNTMIHGYASRGLWESAFELFERMGIGNVRMTDTVTWNTIAGGCVQTSNYRGALELISQMRDHQADLDCVTVVICLDACSHTGFIKLGKVIHGYAVRSHCDELESVKNALIKMYSRCKDLRHARLLFRSIEAKSLITWNSMIAGCMHLDQCEEATFYFSEMLFTRVKANSVAIASILPSCARTMNLLHGKEIHCYIVKQKELKDCLLLWNAVVDFYCKSGKVREAQRVFDSMNEKDKISYTSLIAGYGMQGQGKAAVKLFEEMNMYRIKPDHITMIAILSACSHSGLVFEGQVMFDKIMREYRMYPQMEHFSCMVDLYATAGFLREAVKIISEMPFRPTRAMLATLIKACRIHGNKTIMEWAETQLVDMRAY